MCGGKTLQIGTKGTDIGYYAIVDLTVSTFCRKKSILLFCQCQYLHMNVAVLGTVTVIEVRYI